MKRFLHKLRERLKSMRKGRRSTVYEVGTDAAGVHVRWLTMENETCEQSFRWREVMTVRAFNRDQFSVDCICLAFETVDGWTEVNEDMKGFGGCLDAVEAALPGFPAKKDWWWEVMLPPFAPNERDLWKRENTDQDQQVHGTG